MRLIDADFLISEIESHNDIENRGMTWATWQVVELLKNCLLPPNDPLALKELRRMGGEPVYCVDGYGNECWCLVNCDDGFPCCYDNETGLWDGFFYGMTGDGKHGLHQSGWLAYRRKPENQKDLGGKT